MKTRIIKVPLVDTSDYTTFNNFFYLCRSLNKIPLLDFSKATRVDTVFNTGGYYIYVEEIGGFKNLGKAYRTNASENYSEYKFDMYYVETSHDSLMNIINNLYDIKTKGVKPQQLILGTTNLAKLSEEELAIGTLKGWSIS